MSRVRIVPLGGLGEIGRNCLLLEQGDDALMIDCGVSFPTSDYGVALYHPRFEHVLSRRLSGVVLTHGHEDHAGALPYLARALGRRLAVWGTPHALRVAEARLTEAFGDAPAVARMVAVAPGSRFEVGPFRVETIPMTHSIPQATALCIDTAAGRIVHSGDFKLDDDPLDGVKSDEARLRQIGDEGVALLMSDSTNVFREGRTASERVVADALMRHVADCPQAVVVGLFSSNLYRMDAAARAAAAHGRKLCLLGRSMRMHADIGRALGLLKWPSDWLVHPEIAAEMPRREVLFLASGTQGETRGALRRLASATHSDIRLEPGDVVLLSSRIVPGNERNVYGMIDDLLGFGVDVRWSATDAALHVSGHACRDEQRALLSWIRPAAFIPLHGTRAHLSRHAALAREAGVAEVLTLLDGEVAELSAEGLALAGAAVAGAVAVARERTLSEEVLRQRRQLARSGVIFVALAGPDDVAVSARGLADDVDVVEQLRRAARAAAAAESARTGSREKIREAVRIAVRHRAHELLDDRPPVDVVVLGRGDMGRGER